MNVKPVSLLALLIFAVVSLNAIPPVGWYIDRYGFRGSEYYFKDMRSEQRGEIPIYCSSFSTAQNPLPLNPEVAAASFVALPLLISLVAVLDRIVEGDWPWNRRHRDLN